MKSSALRTPHSALRASAGFTMVEILVVVVIIAMLAGLTVAVALPARTKAKEALIVTEISQLDGALKAYKQKYGSYPPSNMANEAEVRRHINKAFPQNLQTTDHIFWKAFYNGTLAHLSGPQAMVFWLSGFTENPEFPLSTLQPLTPEFTFDKARLQFADVFVDEPPFNGYWDGETLSVDHDGDGLYDGPFYMPPDSDGAPYAYFHAKHYKGLYGLGSPKLPTASPMPRYAPESLVGSQTRPHPGAGIARPYAVDDNADGIPDRFANEDSFQIISAGLDGDYGSRDLGILLLFPTGAGINVSTLTPADGYMDEDFDNLTNFSSSNLQSAIPE